MPEAPAKKGIFDYLTLFLEKVAENKNALVNLIISVIVVASERISTLAVFQCPCNDDAKTGSFWYGIAFLVAPAIVLLIIGYLMDPTTTHLLTGLSGRKKGNYLARSQALFSIFISSSLGPIVWLSIGFLDGRYYACAVTPQPYLYNCSKVTEGKVTFSQDFAHKRVTSQIIGWAMVAIGFLLAAITFTIRQYLTAVSHWQKQYITMTKQIERDEFKTAAKTKIRDDAKKNLGKFLKKERSKEDWDQATELFPVTGRCNKKVGYSSLQTWVKGHPSPAQSQENITENGDQPNDGGSSPSDEQAKFMEHGV